RADYSSRVILTELNSAGGLIKDERQLKPKTIIRVKNIIKLGFQYQFCIGDAQPPTYGHDPARPVSGTGRRSPLRGWLFAQKTLAAQNILAHFCGKTVERISGRPASCWKQGFLSLDNREEKTAVYILHKEFTLVGNGLRALIGDGNFKCCTVNIDIYTRSTN